MATEKQRGADRRGAGQEIGAARRRRGCTAKGAYRPSAVLTSTRPIMAMADSIWTTTSRSNADIVVKPDPDISECAGRSGLRDGSEIQLALSEAP